MNLQFSIPGVVSRRFISEGKGRGLFAEKSFEKGELIFAEKPLFSVQHVYNRATAWTCGSCFKFLGSLNKQLVHYKKIFGVRDQKGEQSELPEFDNLYNFQTKVYSCFAKCGEKYCSEECRNIAFYSHHQVLCVGEQTPETSAMYLFKKHSIETNELFLLAAQAIACLICRVGNDPTSDQPTTVQPTQPQQPINIPTPNNNNTTTTTTTTTTTSSTSNINTEPIIQAPLVERICQEFFSEYQHREWWDVRIDGNFTYEEAKVWSMESLELLRKALVPLLQANPKTNNQVFINTVLSMEFYSHLLGLLEMNDNSIGFFNPLELFRRDINELGKGPFTTPKASKQIKDRCNAIMSSTIDAFRQYQQDQEGECDQEDCDHDHGNHHGEMDHSGHSHHGSDSHGHSHHGNDSEMDMDEHDDEEEEEEEVFPSFDGFGIFGLQAMVNHSCEPNITVVFENHDNRAHIKATRRIEAGEELLHTYIEETNSFEERQEDLITYGFKCDCRKCQQKL